MLLPQRLAVRPALILTLSEPLPNRGLCTVVPIVVQLQTSQPYILPHHRASKRSGDSVAESVGPDLPNVSLRATASDSTRYALGDPRDSPGTH